jgi:hypothetical protein
MHHPKSFVVLKRCVVPLSPRGKIVIDCHGAGEVISQKRLGKMAANETRASSEEVSSAATVAKKVLKHRQ